MMDASRAETVTSVANARSRDFCFVIEDLHSGSNLRLVEALRVGDKLKLWRGVFGKCLHPPLTRWATICRPLHEVVKS